MLFTYALVLHLVLLLIGAHLLNVVFLGYLNGTYIRSLRTHNQRQRFRIPWFIHLMLYFYYTCPDFILLFLQRITPQYINIPNFASNIKDVSSSPLPEFDNPYVEWFYYLRELQHFGFHYFFTFFSYLLYFIAILASAFAYLIFSPFLLLSYLFPTPNAAYSPHKFVLTPQARRSFHSSSKLIHLETNSKISETTKIHQDRYNQWAKKEYEENLITDEFSKFPALFDNLCQKHNFTGSVLDIGCGTGIAGKIILKHNQNNEITGIDFAEEMAKRAVQNGYKEVYVGLMEEAVPSFLNQNKKFDHIVSLASVCFLPNKTFTHFLTSLFSMANKSITLEVDEITSQFLANLEKKLKFKSQIYNNVPVVEKFNLPSGWKVVHEEKKHMWISPTTGDGVNGVLIRYEKDN